MGGMQSPHFQRFKKLCFTAFANLRKSASLIINLISLMVDASIPDIKLEPDKAVMKVQEKFRLDLTEEEAIKHLEGILNETSAWASGQSESSLHSYLLSLTAWQCSTNCTRQLKLSVRRLRSSRMDDFGSFASCNMCTMLVTIETVF